MSPQRGVGCGHVEVSADGRQSHHGADVQQSEDSEEELRRKSGQAERHGQSHRFSGGGDQRVRQLVFEDS